ncbi:TRAP transporter fused permease subunit [Natronoglomus mannanivorans]|uniref:TRAP transporter fused permease subunit n=1 Tax=Natronoglomus mannanivorans TaxID=2979990 RepID=A0AAP3E1M6_9EURY|nr:TRAP transporter fused permease subunit [Halobacteria archaeon AArc-xg1-1]
MSVDDAPESLSEEDTEEILQEVERRRSLRGVAVVVVAIVGVAFSAFQLWIAARGYIFEVTLPMVGEIRLTSLQQLQVNAIHVMFALVLAFILFPPSRGDGFLSRRLARVEPAVRSRFGAESPVTSVAVRARTVVRWFAVDRNMDRVTPLDVVLVVLSILPTYYIVTEFPEIRQMAVFGLAAMRPMHEVYPVTEPFVMAVASLGIPLDEVAYSLLLGVLGILLVLEATRRALGLLLASLVAMFIVYARWGYLVPRDSAIGALAITPTTWDNIVYNLWYVTEAGVFGVPVTVSVRFIYIFVLFGAFLEMSGAGRWFIDLAYSLTGTRRGGPAKASVVSSGFMGMLSGSSVANTVTTGAFTIPLMKRSGYSPEFSGAVESSSSSGGQILPPVMGAAAFLIVEFTGTPFADVIVAATLPALAFFFGMWVMVHFEAVRGGIGGLDASELPRPWRHFKLGWYYIVPLALLVYYLVWARLSINRAGWLTIVAIVVLVAFIAAYDRRIRLPLVGTILALFLAEVAAYAVSGVGLVDAIRVFAGSATTGAGDPLALEAAFDAALGSLSTIVILVSVAFLLVRPGQETPLLELDQSVEDAAETTASALGRPALARNPAYRFGTFVLKSMEGGARTATTVVIAVAAAGVIPGVISVSGLGPNLTALILDVSGQAMLPLLLMTGVAAVVFGLGMPTTVMYIILVAMLGGAIEAFGIAILAAHLFILYFGLMADVTPPVAVAAFAAAGVAKADEFSTATIAFMLSLNKIMVPFAFVFSPGILLLRSGEEGWRIIGTADVVEVSFFLPEVVVPVLGMFLGVYALGVTIIGYQYARVDGLERTLFALASIFLMVPEIPLLILEGLLGLVGTSPTLTGFPVTFSLRLVGLGALLVLSRFNRQREPEFTADDRSPASKRSPGDA